MNNIKNLKLYGLLSVLLTVILSVNAQHFDPFTEGDCNVPMVLPVGVVPTIDGVVLEVGDEIGLFTESGLCAGAMIWDETPGSKFVVAWSDNSITTDTIEGFVNDDIIYYRIWDNSESKEISAAPVYSSGSGFFNTLGTFYTLSSLAAITPVEIIQNPYDQDKYRGDTAVFYVRTVGGSPVSYQWQEFITGMSEWTDMSGENDDTLTFIVAKEDVGRYRCIVSNQTGIDTSSDGELTFRNWIPVLTAVSPQTINEDSSLTVTLSMMTASDQDDTLNDSNIQIIELVGANYSVIGNVITPDADWNGVLAVPVYLINYAGSTPSDTLNCTLTVNSINDLPVLEYSLSDTVIGIGVSFEREIPNNLFSDIDDDLLQITASGMPSGFTFAAGTISGTPDTVRDYSIIITAHDDSNAVVSDTFTLSVQPITEIVTEDDNATGKKFGISAAPNIVKQRDLHVQLLVSNELSGDGIIAIFDNQGDVVDKQEVIISNGGHYSWNLTNMNGVPVTSGVYVVVLTLKDKNGIVNRFTTKIGVRID